jgi:cyanate permease
MSGQERQVATPLVWFLGLAVGSPIVLLPLVMVEPLGLRRFGALGGLTGMAQTGGAALGPFVAGRIFDITRSYRLAFELFIAILLLRAGVALACLPFSVEESRAQGAR